MARTLSEIYKIAKDIRDNNLDLNEYAESSTISVVECFNQVGATLGDISNPSKMSVLDAFTWVTAACIWIFENLLDVFKVDLARDLQNRINGTPAYFANILMRYQSGDELIMSDDGTQFGYANIDTNKRVVTNVAYEEVDEEIFTVVEGGEEKLMGFHDKKFILKVATGEEGAYRQIEEEEMIKIRSYLNQHLFAGQRAYVVSRKGDILVPRFTVYHDGEATEEEVLQSIEANLNEFISDVGFDGVVYTQEVIDYIQEADHVVDVEIADGQGLFAVQYNDDNSIIEDSPGNIYKEVGRYFVPRSGYMRQSTKEGDEATIPTWQESIVLKVENINRQSATYNCICDDHCKCKQ